MPLLTVPSEASSARKDFLPKQQRSMVPSQASPYSVQSKLEEIPGHLIALGAATTGGELGELFAQNPELPGVILFQHDQFAGIISQRHFYKCMSRAFGREIYFRRSAVIMLADVTEKPLVLSSSDSIPHAVEQCLARPADYVYEPFLVYHQPAEQYRLCSFQVLLLAATQIAALRNRQMEQILHSVTDGLLVIDRNFEIGSEYSKAVERIFERDDLSSQSLLHALQPLIDPVVLGQLQDYLKVLFDPKLIDRLIKSINPAKQLTASFTPNGKTLETRTKHLALNFERIRTGTEISQILVRLEDVTQRVNLAKELEQQEASAEEKLHLVMQILQVEPSALHRFREHFDELLLHLSQIAANPVENAHAWPERIRDLFRQTHTLKGEASLLRLTAHASQLHQLEDRLEALRTSSLSSSEDVASLRPALHNLLKLDEQIRQALEQLRQLQAKPSAFLQEPEEPRGLIRSQPSGLTGLLSGLVADLSGRLGKPAHFHTTVQDHDWPNLHEDVLREMLLHLARNSMVHGIESTGERTARGKNPQGLIQVELRSSHPNFHEIIFQDDGQGLPYDKIRRRGTALGLTLASDDDLRQAIFEPGFSTAESVTDLAGRGIGLDAVRHSLQKIGGRIIPHSEPGAYCAFQILLPKAQGGKA